MPRVPRDLNLKERQGVVQSLWTAVNEGGAWLKDVPRIVRTVIETGAWTEREVDGRVVAHKRFIDFITANPRAGCGWPPEKVEALLKNDNETLALWREAVTPELGINQHTMSEGSDIITTLRGDGRGTSKSYTLDRLKRESPTLFERTLLDRKDDDYLSPNAAAIEAGFRKKPTAFEQVQKLLLKLSPTEKRKLKEMLE
jgi:hypothetical protein